MIFLSEFYISIRHTSFWIQPLDMLKVFIGFSCTAYCLSPLPFLFAAWRSIYIRDRGQPGCGMSTVCQAKVCSHWEAADVSGGLVSAKFKRPGLCTFSFPHLVVPTLPHSDWMTLTSRESLMPHTWSQVSGLFIKDFLTIGTCVTNKAASWQLQSVSFVTLNETTLMH